MGISTCKLFKAKSFLVDLVNEACGNSIEILSLACNYCNTMWVNKFSEQIEAGNLYQVSIIDISDFYSLVGWLGSTAGKAFACYCEGLVLFFHIVMFFECC